jgi:peptidoglycan-N-acetylglucosamine deacetylase
MVFAQLALLSRMIHPMFVRVAIFCFLLSLIALPAGAQLPKSDPLQVTVRKALPVDDVPVLPDISAVPLTLPEGRKSVYNRCETTEPVIAITFDDGPDPVLTPRLLDMLKERQIKATFFLVGRNVAAFPAVVKRMVEEGHEVANHSWSHPLLTGLGQDGVESQLRRTHDAIVKACGVEPHLYRPPYGAIGISQRARIEKSFGYSAILWDVDPLDWKKPRSAQKVYDSVLTLTKPGSIILCHDIHETTIAAMPAVLNDLKARGYVFATVTQLIAYTTPVSAPLVTETEAKPTSGIPVALPFPPESPADTKGTTLDAPLPPPSSPLPQVRQ